MISDEGLELHWIKHGEELQWDIILEIVLPLIQDYYEGISSSFGFNRFYTLKYDFEQFYPDKTI